MWNKNKHFTLSLFIILQYLSISSLDIEMSVQIFYKLLLLQICSILLLIDQLIVQHIIIGAILWCMVGYLHIWQIYELEHWSLYV